MKVLNSTNIYIKDFAKIRFPRLNRN
jgi:hypothetical protein